MKRNPISYSIWLIPNEKKYNILNDLINNIAKKYNSIQFIPHVTLLSGFLGDEIELKNKSKLLAKELSPFKININKIDTLNEFFRSFFLTIELNNNFSYAREKSIECFSYIDQNFIPHLSLAYGMHDKKIKEKMKFLAIKKIKRINYFYADAIYLAKNNEINFKWKIIEKYKLG